MSAAFGRLVSESSKVGVIVIARAGAIMSNAPSAAPGKAALKLGKYRIGGPSLPAVNHKQKADHTHEVLKNQTFRSSRSGLRGWKCKKFRHSRGSGIAMEG